VAARTRAALGFSVHIGRAAVVAVGGPPDAPDILGKGALQVATTFEEGAVFHMGQELPLDEARALIRDSEQRFTERARVQLAAFVAPLGESVGAAAMVAAPAKVLPPIESILKAHPLVHAAEGELYRRVFSSAAASLGTAPARVPADALAGRAAAAAGLTPAKLTARLAAMGKASGKPWAADQKQATLAAWIALAG
jgi:hypothetical protein